MGRQNGSALVLAMLVLVLCSALGIRLVAVPFSPGRSAGQDELDAVAKNMARAGAHAATARLPDFLKEGTPYIRRFPLKANITGRYTVTCRPSGGSEHGDGRPASGVREFELLSEGSVEQAPEARHRIRLHVRYAANSAGGSAWKLEESRLPAHDGRGPGAKGK